ncbi:hypothetical protein CHCC14809_3860 [Bacillus licheniformis]|uniref:Uncharacterized protein n=1 Tax=Bacillus licheniformis TaxID=1402 RepID=A0A8B5YFV7_BACLI|nr:hypothetical protein MUY_000163 [Bacillus licheniformis WX-02]KYC76991.1 hypothetical protein B4090_0220 [Bacillus licheniformis]TWN09384.1 hypothetical protein CHCC14564_4154 [Bacillus licheniformis LMG 17339]KYC77814.1 hypothetical protein B4092_0160 [Bacillus licheniformis]KYC86083.1 hypothetical protein B4091_0088 [Bacillus licheniformis]
MYKFLKDIHIKGKTSFRKELKHVQDRNAIDKLFSVSICNSLCSHGPSS